MLHKIVLCGGNGAGKSTMGRALAQALNLRFLDIEQYYFPDRLPNEAYGAARTQEEVTALLLADLQKPEGCVLAAVKADYSREIGALLTCAVYIDVPKDIRMQRIRQRSYGKFGDRMLPGGDLYEREQRFFDMVQNRTVEPILQWLSSMEIPVIRIDGLLPVEENLQRILEQLPKAE